MRSIISPVYLLPSSKVTWAPAKPASPPASLPLLLAIEMSLFRVGSSGASKEQKVPRPLTLLMNWGYRAYSGGNKAGVNACHLRASQFRGCGSSNAPPPGSSFWASEWTGRATVGFGALALEASSSEFKPRLGPFLTVQPTWLEPQRPLQ